MRQLTMPVLIILLTYASMGPHPVRAEHEGKVQIVLLGDSTTEGSVPRRIRFARRPEPLADRFPVQMDFEAVRLTLWPVNGVVRGVVGHGVHFN